MIDRLRAFMHRPLADSNRARLFVVAVAAIGLGAAGFALIGDPSRREPAPEAARSSGEKRASTPSASPADALELPSEEGPATRAVASGTDVEAAKSAARRFLDGYLRYSYQQTRAQRIEEASEELRRRLEADPPRVPAGERKRRPRVLLIHADGAGNVRAAMVALVTDGARRYTVRLELEQRRDGWTVTNVGS